MFDYYALPEDFPGYLQAADIADVRDRIAFLENKLAEDIGFPNFIPYIQLHEFEALLFADISKLTAEYPLCSQQIQTLKQQTDIYGDPEMIDNGPHTAPSKRIIKALETKYNYNKVQSGASVASAIGIETMLGKCLHFARWIQAIKNMP